jgi:1,2-phenylacetyl-CoA epoxidase catalytic subunit
VPDLAENFMGLAASLLKEKHHGVLISAIQLCTELCKASRDALEYLRKVRASISTWKHTEKKNWNQVIYLFNIFS